ncbi:hypothetical protein FO519_009458 [Halicephalobus sp. NKZ332]|nr:hypothetical protein FO519_009458 [Halicephalobus sp. NKZ332]
MAAEPSTRPVEEDYVKKLNLAGTKDIPSPKDREKRIKPRRFHKKFKVRCPWVNCFATPLTWHCAHCGNELEVFEEENEVYFSCHCGDRKMTDFYGKCSHDDHPEIAIPFTEDLKKLINFEDNQREQRTIILLGESGAGKSTSINNLITTVHYDTWNEAKEGECINAVPLWRTIMNGTGDAVERKEYLIMVVDTAGNNDAADSKVVEEKNQLNIVEQIVFLGSFNMICFFFKCGGQRIHEKMPHTMVSMKNILTQGFNTHTSFLQTSSASFNADDTETTIIKLVEKLNLKFNTIDNIYPVNNEPYLAILNQKLYKDRPDILKKYRDQTHLYGISAESFRALIKKAIENEEFVAEDQGVQVARIKIYARQDMETIFKKALELAELIEKQSQDLNLNEEEKERIRIDEQIRKNGKEFYENKKSQNPKKTFENAEDEDSEEDEEIERLINADPNEESTKKDSITNNSEEANEIKDSTIKELLLKIKALQAEFKDDKVLFIGIGITVVGIVGVGVAVTMFLVPPVIPMMIYGGTGAAGSAVIVIGNLTILVNHLKKKTMMRKQAKECINAVAVIDKYCKNINCDVSFDYLSELKKQGNW